MSDPEATAPPRQPNTFRTWLPRFGKLLWGFIWKWRVVTIPVATFLLGIAVGYGLHK